MDTFAGSSFGQSSPWVERAEIVKKEPVGADKWRVLLRFSMMTSQGAAGTRSEWIEITKVEDEYLVSRILKDRPE